MSEQAVYWIDPLKDARWTHFVEKHSRSSLFHSRAWLESLKTAYGYKPVALTTSAPDSILQNALVCCRIDSWLTGRRLVSLPFSDHCDYLDDESDAWRTIASALEEELHRDHLRYVELRPRQIVNRPASGTFSSYEFCSHEIDLRPGLDVLFRACHKDCTQRKIRRAEREGLTYEEGRSPVLLDRFCQLLAVTRRRHGIPCQPKAWFENLIGSFGESLKIRVASRAGESIAAILTVRHKDTLVYKYGCSDARHHQLGGMHLLFWQAIQDAKREDLRTFDLGRSEWSNPGLVAFKDRWGAARSTVEYVRLLASAKSKDAYSPTGSGWKERAARKLVPHLPDFVLNSAGEMIYRHVG